MRDGFNSPAKKSYDVVIIGGAMYGSSVAWWVSRNPDFDGSVLVVERDMSFESAATSHTNSCIRQQFSNQVNVGISQFGAEFINNFRRYMEDDEAPSLSIQSFGYMYLASDETQAEKLKAAQSVQAAMGAATEHLSAAEIKASYPFYNMDDILCGNHNRENEGYFDGGTIFDWLRRKSKENGVEVCNNEVVDIHLNAQGSSVETVTLKTGEQIACGQVVNCSGTRGSELATMIGAKLPIEPRKRFTFVFAAEKPLDQDLPLTIDPSGVHVRSDGAYYMAGCSPHVDGSTDEAVALDDFEMNHNLWENEVWPVLAHRVPQFEAIKLVNYWVGHYDYNTLDQNAILGPDTKVSNFLFCNGFSGHGLQQSPAVGRGLSEVIIYGEYRSLDLSELAYKRVEADQPFLETAVI